MAWSLKWELTGWNAGAERMFGYTRAEALATSIDALWTPESRKTLTHLVAGLVRNEEIARFETEYLRCDGAAVEVSVSITAIRDADRRVTGVASVVRDISQRKRSDRLLAEERTRWVSAFHSAPIGMALIDLQGGWLEVNRSLCRLLDRDREALLAAPFHTLTDPNEPYSPSEQLPRLLAHEIEGEETELRFFAPDGGVVWARLSLGLVRGLRDEPLYFVGQFQDVTAAKESEAALSSYADQLAQLARVDPVTGLANYREFHAQLDHELQRATRHGQEWSVVLFDIDGFTRLNEADRIRGDRALALTGEAIQATCRASDRAARIGADEFALILPNTGPEQARTAAARVTSAVKEAGVASLSYGAVTWPHDGDSVELLLLRADMSLQAAKPRNDVPIDCNSAASTLETCPTDAVQELVAVAQKFLAMDVAFLAKIEDDTQVFQTLSGDSLSFGLNAGVALNLEGTYCQRMLDGRIPNAVPVVAHEAELVALPITTEAGVGAYLGVPVSLANGHTYGTLCAISHDPVPALADVDLGVMRSFAGLIANHIEHDVLEGSEQRSRTELIGVNALLSALTARDHYTGEHSEVVVELASAVARRLGLSPDEIREIEQVALLHDIGKVGIPDSILRKHGPLTDEEWEVMHQHPSIGARILAGVPTFAHLAAAVNAEHERYDGTGYPDKLQGGAIPLASRIAFACDAYHAMTSDRPYRRALDAPVARGELQRGAGTQFDPRVVDALLDVLSGSTSPDRDPRQQLRRGELTDVLNASLPRQTPTWKPAQNAGASQILGHARAECLRCGSHSPITVTSASVGGNCTNCGSYELQPILERGEADSGEGVRNSG